MTSTSSSIPVENLVTEQSLSSSLAPPRAPPIGTAQRNLLCDKDPSHPSAYLTHHHQFEHAIPNRKKQMSKRAKVQCHHGLHDRVRALLTTFHQNNQRKKSNLFHTTSNAIMNDHNQRPQSKTQPHLQPKPQIFKSHKFTLRLPHPHISFAPDSGDQFTRWLGSTLPITWQHKSRDDGTFRSISDNLVTMTVPSLAIVNPSAAKRFMKLSHFDQVHDNSNSSNMRLRYGSHPMQYIELFIPPEKKRCGLVFFVHGGAWGSGKPWMYRLTATPFLDAGMAVAIVGYRTYPDGNVQDQVDDLEDAARVISQGEFGFLAKRPALERNSETIGVGNEIKTEEHDDRWKGVVLMGHSSGSHISLLMAVERVEKALTGDSKMIDSESTLQFDSFVGLSGVYSISHHFDYEAGRGVEELSPMKAACGFTRSSFDHFSPAMRLQSLLRLTNGSENVDEIISGLMPEILLVHGVEDTTVPFTSTSEAGRILRSCGVLRCEEAYIVANHPDPVMELMIGGRTRTLVMDWLESRSALRAGPRLADRIQSKL